MSQATIQVAIQPARAMLKVNGRGTFEITEAVRRFVSARLESACPLIVFDLSGCTGMDSTFMGILAMASRGAMAKKAVIELANCTPDVKKGLITLGLKALFRFTDNVAIDAALSREQQHRNILEAHQTLVDAHEGNRAEFQDLIKFLKENPE
jgi:anti-sigma B factor antagonist